MITNPDWLKPVKPYFHQTKLSSAHVSLYCIEELAEYIESNDIEKMDCDTCWKIEKQILTDDIGRSCGPE